MPKKKSAPETKPKKKTASPTKRRRRSRLWYILYAFLALVLIAVIIARVYLNTWVTSYVNKSLNKIEGYRGSVELIDVDLYRGAYRIINLKLYKRTGNIPTPFLDIATTDLSIEWGALLQGRIVSNIDMYKPIINFATNKAGTVSQTGAGVDWSKHIRDLMPIDINLVTFQNGKVTYQDFSTKPKADLYINNMYGQLRNLRNVDDVNNPLPSQIDITGDSIGGGKLKLKGKLNILKRIMDIDVDTNLENVNLPALSDYSNAYAAIDIRKGTINLYSEVVVKNGRLSGYIKPIATHVELIDLRKEDNILKAAWQVVVGTVVEIFSNYRKDQFATKIKLEGNLDNVKTDTWSTVTGILRNAFIEAFKKGIDGDVKA